MYAVGRKVTSPVKPYNTKITITPETAEVGGSVNITCNSEGRPEPRYNITHDGTMVSTEKTYTISKVKLSDAVIYKCIAWNKHGRDSASANLTVEVKLYNTKITITPEIAEIGRSVTITCNSEGRPEPRYNITHDGTMLSTGKTYTISKVKLSDAGTYRCIAWNKLGSDPASANLTVEDKPSSNDAGSGIEWYIVAVILVSGIIIVILLSYIVWCSRRRWFRNRNLQSNPGAQTNEVDTTYQELDLTKMNTEDNYQSLRNRHLQSNLEPTATEVDKTYQALDLSKMNTEDNYQSLRNRHFQSNLESTATEVDKTYQALDPLKMNTEDNYQSLRNRNLQSNPDPPTTEVDPTYQAIDLSKMNTEDNYQPLIVNVASNGAGGDDGSYTDVKARGLYN